MRKDIPATLWIALAALAIITVLTLLSMLKSGSPVRLVAAACNIALLIGLARGQKWAYVLTVVFSVLGVAVAFNRGPSHIVAILIGNGLVVVPVLLSTSFFFPPPRHEQDP